MSDTRRLLINGESIPLEDDLDQPEEHKSWFQRKRATINWPFWKEMILVLAALFVAESSRGIVAPSLSLYIEDNGGGKRELGMIVAIFSVGRLFGSIFFGWWYNRRGGREVLVGSLLLSVIGNFMYSFAPLNPNNGWWIILISRLIVGTGTGILSVVRACIADATTVEQRTRFMAYSSAAQFLGFAVVPGVGAILTFIDFNIGTLPIDKYTSAGFVLAFFNMLMAVIIFFTFPYRKPGEEAAKNGKKQEELPKKLYWIGAGVFIGLNFIARGVLALLETTGAPVFQEIWQDTDGDAVQDTSYMMLFLGLIGLVIFFFIDKLEKYIAEWVLLFVSFIIIGAGGMILFDYTGNGLSLPQFLVGAGCIWSLGSPIAQTIILSAFSKILGSKPQGEMMGWIGSAGSVGRIVFPLLGGFFGNDPSFMVSAVTSFLCAFGVIGYNFYVKRARSKIQRNAIV